MSAKIWVNANFSVFRSQTKGKNKTMQIGIQTHFVSLVVKSTPSSAGQINLLALLFVTHRMKVPPSYCAMKYTYPRQKLSCEQNKRTSVKYLPHLPMDFSPSSDSESQERKRAKKERKQRLRSRSRSRSSSIDSKDSSRRARKHNYDKGKR